MNRVPVGFYFDHVEGSDPIEVIGTGFCVQHNARYVILKVPGDETFYLMTPAQFLQTLTVKAPENLTAKVVRFIPAVAVIE